MVEQHLRLLLMELLETFARLLSYFSFTYKYLTSYDKACDNILTHCLINVKQTKTGHTCSVICVFFTSPVYFSVNYFWLKKSFPKLYLNPKFYLPFMVSFVWIEKYFNWHYVLCTAYKIKQMIIYFFILFLH